MNADERRELLRAVADGEVEPAEAAARLGGRPQARSHPPSASATAAEPESIERVRVRGVGAGITIIGDPTIATIDVRGDHQLWSEGTTLVVRVDDSSLERGQHRTRRSGGGRRRRTSRRGNHQGPVATIRVNPSLPLRVVAHLSAVEITSMTAPLVATVNMGVLTLGEVTAPFDAVMRAGRLKVTGCLTTGDSTIRARMSKVDIRLDARSDVAVRAAIERGQVSVRAPGHQSSDGPDRVVVGSGAASLDIRGRMGSVAVAVAEPAPESPR
jgi:hypothetical protein